MKPHVVRSIRLALVAALAALCASLLLTGAAAGASAPVKGPAGAKFYKPPKQLPRAHGKLIWQRRAGGLTPIAGARSNRLVLYTSRTPQGRTTAVSGSVSVPKGKPPRGGWPVITYAHGTTGTADSCAPTRIGATTPVAPYVEYMDPQFQDWINAGYAVVRTDYQGLGTPGRHPYLIGEAEGRGVLDIVSAARTLNPNLSRRYLIAGHSQGGHAALFAAGIAQSWTPKLRLRGTVAYAPASHILQQTEFLPSLTTPSSLSALAALIVEGGASQSSTIQVSQILEPAPLALFSQVNRTCLPQLAEPTSFGGIAPADLLRNDAQTDELYGILGEQNPAVKTSAPILLLQGTSDTTVFPFLTSQLNGELVALGDSVTYTEYPGVTHGEIPAASEAEALGFFEQRLPPRR